MSFTLTITELAKITAASAIEGSRSAPIKAIASLAEAGADDLSFLGNPKYITAVATSKAGVILVPADFAGKPNGQQVYLRVEKPSYALALICSALESQLWPQPPSGIHASAVIAKSAKVDSTATVGPLCVVGENSIIGPGVVLEAQCNIGKNVSIGQRSWFKSGVTIADYCVVGARCRFQPGVVIGSDGFGYEPVGQEIHRIPQIGNVVIEDDVEVGANTTVDRARFSQTTIGRGTKIDNLVQIAHNVRIGKQCLIAAQVGIAGSSILGDYCVLGGQAGVAGHLTLGDRVQLGAQSGLFQDVDANEFYNGTPASPIGLERRLVVLSRKLPDLFKKVDSLAASLDSVRRPNS